MVAERALRIGFRLVPQTVDSHEVPKLVARTPTFSSNASSLLRSIEERSKDQPLAAMTAVHGIRCEAFQQFCHRWNPSSKGRSLGMLSQVLAFDWD
eukprot:6455107-Amphidinium_carterae.1